MRQIRFAMRPVGEFKVRKESGRMFVEGSGDFDYDEAVEALQKVFGIVGICPMVVEEDKDIEHLRKTVLAFIDDQYPEKEFHIQSSCPQRRQTVPNDFYGTEYGYRRENAELEAFEGIKVECSPSGCHGKY